MTRRRIDPVGRAALQAAYWAEGGESGGGPVIFASRWGEIARSLVLLQQSAKDECLSPTQFSLSVHNAVGALYSMARQDRQNYLAVAAGDHSAEAGICEAMGLLAEGAPTVLLVCFDRPLPDAYATLGQVDVVPMPYAWACVLGGAEEGSGVSLRPVSGAFQMEVPAGTPSACGGLAVLDFLVGQSSMLERPARGGGWRWSRASP